MAEPGNQGDGATEVIPVRPLSPLVAATRAPAPAALPSALIGRTLGKFTIVQILGQGGSGEVYRAEQPQLGRSAVIKVLRREHSTSSHRTERFLREAQLASRLDHPYAAHIYAFGVESDGIFWIAMEHVRGMTLDELVARRGAMPPTLFGPLFGRLCEVVHTAHELGIVHRDIKGSNVMVIERAGQLLPKLLDFGIAKGVEVETGTFELADPADVTLQEPPGLTGHGATLGSPHYMAPEQWESPAGVDARADIYALGVLAYRCVAATLPFAGLDRTRLAAAHLAVAPPPLPASVPLAISEVIVRALAKQPGARWPTALAFGEAMRAAIGGGVAEAVPIFDPALRDQWVRSGPQPLADAVARLARAATTVEADAALRELVAITARWLAVLALSDVRPDGTVVDLREQARAVVGRDDNAPWIRLARAAVAPGRAGMVDVATPGEVGTLGEAAATPGVGGAAASVATSTPGGIEAKLAESGLRAALAQSGPLEVLAARLDDRERSRTTAALASDISAVGEALAALEPLLAYQLVMGRGGGAQGSAESWQGVRRRDRERVIVWGEPLADGEVALLDPTGRVAVRLSPLVQVSSPLPSAEPELFLLWRSGKGAARLVAAPWGFERDDEAAAQRMALLTTEDTDTLHDTRDDRSPYPGLAAYGLDDADRFVGREREVEALANRLVRAPMVAVLGPSGAGKSSFIHAGLLPRLAESYEIITMRPGRHPLHALAALPPIGVDPQDPAALAARLRALGERAPRGLVIVIDQLEELVTLCTDATERAAFARTLADAAADRDAPVRVVVTLRDDFATVIESVESFRGRFEVFVLATPPPEALRRIVTEPARRAAVVVDATVVDEMVAEVAGRPASLPLLSFTASQLWAKRDRAARRITHDAYLEIGGVAGALSTYADHVYASLARKDQAAVRNLFARLVASDGTRIPALRAELEQLPGAASVLAHLVDARLLVVREDDDHDVVEIVHECLATRWDRLARWRSEDAADRALLGDVGIAARRWHDGHRQSDLLWRGAAQTELQLLADRATALTAVERAFAKAGSDLQKRARRIRRAIVAALMITLGIVAIVMGYLSVAANDSRSEAERNAAAATKATRIAEDRLTTSMVAQGRRELGDNRALAALAYLGEAMRRGADSTAIRTMVGFANRGWRFVRAVDRRDLSTIVALPDAIVIADPTGTLRWLDPRGTQIAELATGVPALSRLTVTPTRLVGASREGLVVVDLATRTVLHRFKARSIPGIAHAGPGADELTVFEETGFVVYDLDGTVRRTHTFDPTSALEPVFDPTGRFVLYETSEALTHVDLVTMTATLVARDPASGPNDQVHGPILGYLAKDATAHLLSHAGTELVRFKPTNAPIGLAFDDAGERIAAVSEHSIEVFDPKGKLLYTLPVFAKQVSVRMRGDHTWTSSADGVVRHYVKGMLAASLPVHETEVYEIYLFGDAIASIASTGTVVISDADASQVIRDPEPCPGGDDGYGAEGPTVSYLCDGKQLLYLGRKRFAVLTDTSLGLVALERTSGQIAIASKRLYILARDGQIAAQADETGDWLSSIAWESPTSLFIVEPRRGAGLWRWTFAANRWEKLLDVPKAVQVVSVRGQPLLASEEGELLRIDHGAITQRRALGDRMVTVIVSPDQRWLAVQLGSGATAIVDSTTLDTMRTLAPADTGSYASSFDTTSDLMVRMARGSLVISDRVSGEDIVRNLDLARGASTALFQPDGRLELAGDTTALIDVPRDERPVAAILADLACRVPLRVAEGRLESVKVQCAP